MASFRDLRPPQLVGKLPVTGALVRSTLLERTVRHSSGRPDGPRAAPGCGGCCILFRPEGGCCEGEGVERICIPKHSTKSAERKREQKERWFCNEQK
jgi:hypothetical protein